MVTREVIGAVCVVVKHKRSQPFCQPSIPDQLERPLVIHNSIATTSLILLACIKMSRFHGHRPPYDRPDMYDDRPDEAYHHGHGHKSYHPDASNGNDGF